MATDALRQRSARRRTMGSSQQYAMDETKMSLKTTEFWAMVGLIAAILIAAAVSDSLNDIRAWTLVTVVGAAYIVSRGVSKISTDHTRYSRRPERR